MIKAIIFDCFGVLYVNPSHHFYHQQLANYSELKDDLADLHKLYDRGWSSFDEYTAGVAELTGLDIGTVRQNILGKVQANQELIDYSQQLRQDYRVGLLSNIGRGGMEQFFSSQQQAELFDAVVLSSDVGYAKPEVEIYRLMAERIGVEPASCVMIDDAEENCAGAVAAGMRAVYYRDNQQLVGELTDMISP